MPMQQLQLSVGFFVHPVAEVERKKEIEGGKETKIGTPLTGAEIQERPGGGGDDTRHGTTQTGWCWLPRGRCCPEICLCDNLAGRLRIIRTFKDLSGSLHDLSTQGKLLFVSYVIVTSM